MYSLCLRWHCLLTRLPTNSSSPPLLLPSLLRGLSRGPLLPMPGGIVARGLRGPNSGGGRGCLAARPRQCRGVEKTAAPPNTASRTVLYGCLGAAAYTGFNLAHSKARCDAAVVHIIQPSLISDGFEAAGVAGGKKEPSFDWPAFWRLLWPDALLLLGAVLSALVVAYANIEIPRLLGSVVNVLTKLANSEGGGSGDRALRSYIDEVRGPAVRLLQTYIYQAGFTFAYITMLSYSGERMAGRLRKKLFSNILAQDIGFFDTHRTGEIVSRLATDIQDFKSSFKQCVSQGLRSVTQIAGSVVSLLLVSPSLTGSMMVVVPMIVGVGTLIGRGLRQLSRAAQAQVSSAIAVADEAIGNIRTVRAFSMEDKESELFSDEVDKSTALSVRLGVGVGLFQGLSNLALNGMVLGTIAFGGSLVCSNQLTPGDLMAFLVATQTIQRSLAQLSLLFGSALRGLSAGARVFEYMKLTPSVVLAGSGSGKKIPYHTMVGEIKFKDVTFTYPSRPGKVVLDGLNLVVPGGKLVALVGLSGGGKSTVAALLERFYDVDNGQITIDGEDIKTLDPKWLRGHAIGFISQEPVLFGTSILENIRYGRPTATDEEVKEVAVQANAHSFISQFPDGYNTVVGEHGVMLSGGQKQRIAIARALIKNPSILILDEATSALDAESERAVQDALERVIRGRTVLVIAHRLSTVRGAHLIAVVDNGKIVEMGNHETLSSKKGSYWKLTRQQQSGGAEERKGFFG